MNKRIIDVILIETDKKEELQSDILFWSCNRGFKLYGNPWSIIGPETNKYQGLTIYYQMMVKYEEDCVTTESYEAIKKRIRKEMAQEIASIWNKDKDIMLSQLRLKNYIEKIIEDNK